ncbi:hypothetical protein Hdeb2414_s0009g00311781 [Helianthus debilis subsp. tardiflorus]
MTGYRVVFDCEKNVLGSKASNCELILFLKEKFHPVMTKYLRCSDVVTHSFQQNPLRFC